MAITKWNQPYNNYLSPMNSWLWDDSLSQSRSESGLDVYETDDEVVVEAALPGLTEDEVEVFYEDGILRITGEKSVDEEQKNKRKAVYKETSYRSFDYMTTLPRSVESDSIEADMEDGIVRVTAPIAAESKPRKIKAKRKNKKKEELNASSKKSKNNNKNK